MAYSDIFDDYLRREFEKMAEKESKELKKYKEEAYPRVGSDTKEVIENLYGNKMETAKEMQYKKNIIEVAHPNKTILLPAYDKLNALVENENERMQIMLNITNKPSTGYLTQHRYAQQELAKSLVAIANDLDNRNMTSLRDLADECLSDLHKQAFEMSDIGKFFGDIGEDALDVGKGAGSGAEIGAIAGGLIGAFGGSAVGPLGTLSGAWAGAQAGTAAGAALGGILSSIFATGPKAKNVSINSAEAKQKISSLLEDHKSDVFLASYIQALTHLHDLSDTYAQVVDNMHVHSTDQQLKNSVHSIAETYKTDLQDVSKMNKIFLSNAKLGRYEEEGGAWEKLTSPFKNVFGGTLHDAIESVEALDQVMTDALKDVLNVENDVSSTVAQMASSSATNQQTPVKPNNDKSGFENLVDVLSPFVGEAK
jgi:hypothetical protein